MEILVFKVGKEKERVIVNNNLRELQAIVGGYIEVVPLKNNLLLVCNEEGKLMGLKPNHLLMRNDISKSDVIMGDFFLCGRDSDDFTDVPQDAELLIESLLFPLPV